MNTIISITTHAYNESESSKLKRFLVEGMGFEHITTEVLSETFSIDTKILVSLLKNDSEINEIYNRLVMRYLGSYMPNFILMTC